MAGAYDYLASLLGKKQEAQKAPAPPPDPTAGMTTAQKIKYYSPEQRKARAAQAAQEKQAAEIRALNPVDPSGGWFQKLLNKPAEAKKK